MRDIVDLDRYPLDRPDSPAYAALADQCRAELDAVGAAVLEGFVTDDALARARAELAPVTGNAFYKIKTHNPYLVADDPELSGDHPRNAAQVTESATLAYDFIPPASVLQRLYAWPAFAAFVADLLGHETLYPFADALSPVNVLVYRPGAGTGWHFDGAQFVVTLVLQQGDGGGVFEYAPFIRSDGDPGYGAVRDVLARRSEKVATLAQPAGSLVVFTGSRTLHRVTPVTGVRERLVGVFSLAPEPGRALDVHTRQTFYGRVG